MDEGQGYYFIDSHYSCWYKYTDMPETAASDYLELCHACQTQMCF